VKAQLRHHWSTQVPRTTAVSNAPSGTEAVSSMDATQEVAVVQDGIKTVMHVRAAPSSAAIAVLAALRPPSSNVGPRTGMRAHRQGFGAVEA